MASSWGAIPFCAHKRRLREPRPLPRARSRHATSSSGRSSSVGSGRAYEQHRAARVFVHIANAQLFAEITGMAPPPSPITAQDYSRAGLPWFDLYDVDRAFLDGSEVLQDVWSIAEVNEAKIGPAAPMDESIDLPPSQVVGIAHHRGLQSLDGEW